MIQAQEDPVGLALENSGLNETEKVIVLELAAFQNG
jgi:hypothetical protein